MPKFLDLFRLSLIAVAALVTCLGSNASAQATATRAFVSATGTDSSACAISTPCKTFAAALSTLQSGGELYCLSSGKYGPVVITQSVSIICDHYDATLSASSGPVVQINAGTSGQVILQGLHISALGSTSGRGIEYDAGASVLVDKCVISGFTQGTGILALAPNITVKDSTIVANASGIQASFAQQPQQQLSGIGSLTVIGSLLSANNIALSLTYTPYASAVEFDKSQLTGNGYAVNGNGNWLISFSGSLVASNGTLFYFSGAGSISSYGNNQFANNGGAPGPNTTGYTSVGPQ